MNESQSIFARQIKLPSLRELLAFRVFLPIGKGIAILLFPVCALSVFFLPGPWVLVGLVFLAVINKNR
jgi:hypothetical protein